MSAAAVLLQLWARNYGAPRDELEAITRRVYARSAAWPTCAGFIGSNVYIGRCVECHRTREDHP